MHAQAGAGADEDREARTGDLGAPLEVDHTESRSEIPVGLGLESNCPWRADSPDLEVVGRALPHRDALVQEVRDREQAAVPALLDRIELHAHLLDLLGARAARLLDLRRVEPLSFRARDFIARSVLFALQAFELRQQPASARFERRKLLSSRISRRVAEAVGRIRGVGRSRKSSGAASCAHLQQRSCVTRTSRLHDSANGSLTEAARHPFLPATKVQPKEMLVLVDKRSSVRASRKRCSTVSKHRIVREAGGTDRGSFRRRVGAESYL